MDWAGATAHDMYMAMMRTYGGARPGPAPQALGRCGSASDPLVTLSASYSASSACRLRKAPPRQLSASGAASVFQREQGHAALMETGGSRCGSAGESDACVWQPASADQLTQRVQPPAASASPCRPRHARWRAEPATRRRASAWPSRTRAGRRHPTTRLNKGVPHPTCTLQRSQTSRRLVDAANGGQ